MDMWNDVRAAFLDELEKIAEVSLAGLSPAAALSSQARPMETAGFQKAKEVFERAEAMKTASPYSPGTLPGLQTAANSKTENQKAHPSAISQTKSVGAHILGGMGAGGFLSNFAHGPGAGAMEGAARKTLHARNWQAAAAGGVLGAGEYARQRLKRRRLDQQQKTAMISPAMQLRASKQVAKVGNSTRATSSIAEHVRGSQIHH